MVSDAARIVNTCANSSKSQPRRWSRLLYRLSHGGEISIRSEPRPQWPKWEWTRRRRIPRGYKLHRLNACATVGRKPWHRPLACDCCDEQDKTWHRRSACDCCDEQDFYYSCAGIC